MRALAFMVGLSVLAVPVGAQQAERVYAPHEVEEMPLLRNREEFSALTRQNYPPAMRAAGAGGDVEIRFVVGADGLPRDIVVVSSTAEDLNAPTLRSVAGLRFSPATVDGRPVAVSMRRAVMWQVDTLAERSDGERSGPAGAGTAPDEGDALLLGVVEVLPRPTNTAAFAREMARLYPRVLRDAGVPGLVHVRFRVEADGTITGVNVVSATDSAFIQPTLRALSVLRYEPARMDGRAVPVWVELPVRWQTP